MPLKEALPFLKWCGKLRGPSAGSAAAEHDSLLLSASQSMPSSDSDNEDEHVSDLLEDYKKATRKALERNSDCPATDLCEALSAVQELRQYEVQSDDKDS